MSFRVVMSLLCTSFGLVRLTVALTILTVFVLIVGFALAGDDSPTGTPAPSKTPSDTEMTDTSESTEVPEDMVGDGFMEPLNQSDLSVLAGNVQRPNGIYWHENKLFTVCNGDWTMYEVDATTGATRTYIYGIRNAHTLYAENASATSINLWVPDFDTNSLMLVNLNRAPQTIASNLDGPWGIELLDEEYFVVTSLLGNQLLLINRQGGVRELVGDLRSPTGVSSDDNRVYVANNGSSRRSIEWLAKDDMLTEENLELQPLVQGLQSTTNITVAADGLLYFTYAVGTRGVVGRVDPELCVEQGGCSNDQVEIVLYTELAAPLAGLTISPDMRLFVHTIFRPEIYWVQLEE